MYEKAEGLMIRFDCPNCGKGITAADAHAGKKGRCPACQKVLVLPNAGAAAAEDVPRPTGDGGSDVRKAGKAAVSARKGAAQDEDVGRVSRRSKSSEEDLEDLDEVEEYVEEDDEEPRRKPAKKRRGPFADCPNCGCRGHATKERFTWWGGLLGPSLLSHVRCKRCGTCYNGKHGDLNNVRIGIYVGVSLGIALIILGVGVLTAVR